jgi:hypothetical protein
MFSLESSKFSLVEVNSQHKLTVQAVRQVKDGSILRLEVVEGGNHRHVIGVVANFLRARKRCGRAARKRCGRARIVGTSLFRGLIRRQGVSERNNNVALDAADEDLRKARKAVLDSQLAAERILEVSADK